MAHQVSLDMRGGVVYSVCNSLGAPQRDLHTLLKAGSAVLVLPDCGVTMLKSKDRPLMSRDVIQLRNMHSCGAEAFATGATCFMCTVANGAEQLMTCPLCMNTMHASCGRARSRQVLLACGAATHVPQLVEVIDDSWSLCSLCTYHVGNHLLIVVV